MQPKQQKLGRGLSSLIGTEISAGIGLENVGQDFDSKRLVQLLSLKAITPGKSQPRQFFKDEDIESLSDSIRQNGVLQPILVRQNKEDNSYEIIAGERRWRAALRAQLTEIPAIIKDMDDATALTVALVENIQREDLSPLEEAEGFQRLLDEIGLTQEKISEAVGKSRSHIANTLRLLQLPNSIKEILHNLEISPGHARCLIGLSEEEGLRIIDDIIQKKLNVRQVERLVRQRQKPQNHKTDESAHINPSEKLSQRVSEDESESELQNLAGKIEEKVNLKTVIEIGDNDGKVVLSFENYGDLDMFMQRISTIKVD